jgi:agmatine deiminase
LVNSSNQAIIEDSPNTSPILNFQRPSSSFYHWLLFFFSCITIVLPGYSQNGAITPAIPEYTSANRTAAEWEPALGTLIIWPLAIPYKLAIELAKDNHLYTLVNGDSARKEAAHWYKTWGIDSSRNTFLVVPQGVDASWTRDWGPAAVFPGKGKMMLADPKYIYATPASSQKCSDSLFFIYGMENGRPVKTQTDDDATVHLGKSLGLPVLDLPFISTGGNVLTDGAGTAFSSCILLNENQFFGINEESFRKMNREKLGFRNYHILPNFERGGIQHLDCFMKLLDQERILVAEPPKDHNLYALYDSIVRFHLTNLKTSFGRPYEILRIKTNRYNEEKLAAYTNSLILNRTIYVPLFRIKEDSLALETFRRAMPGYTVKGFYFDLKDEPYVSKELADHYQDYGWNSGDALHCRTRAIWNPEMLLIQVKRLPSRMKPSEKKFVVARIIDYSHRGLKAKETQLKWRVAGKGKWHSIRMSTSKSHNDYFAEIPSVPAGREIEYFVEASSLSGHHETMPKTAPSGTYKLSITKN